MYALKISKWGYLLIGSGLITAMAIILFLMGRIPWCDCGYIKLWHSIVMSSENSQHLFDWYSFSHIIHGLGFYLLLFLADRKQRLSFKTKLLLAIFLEASWEIFENTDMVINRYRSVTISLDYYGDSIVNSIGDVLAMILGFWIAAKQSVWFSLAVFIIIELLLLYFIRDNLTLNIIMLAYPLDAIKLWQAGN